MRFNVNQCYDLLIKDKGLVNLICYEATDEYAFLCPYDIIDDSTVTMHVKNTCVFTNFNDDNEVIPLIDVTLEGNLE